MLEIEFLYRNDPGFRVFAFLVAVIFGLNIGSFLNVCIYRMPAEISLWRRGSFCPKCGAPVRWRDNIPVFAWLIWLRGRCRACGVKISARYPAIEILSGFLAVACLWRFGVHSSALVYFLLMAALVVATFIDLDHMIIPNEISVGGIPVGVGLAFLGYIPVSWQSSLIGAGVGIGLPLVFSLLYYLIRRKEGLGMGDVKLLGTLGAFTGWEGALFSLMVGSFLGALVAFAFMFLGKTQWTSRMPFGPALAAGAILYILVGNPLAHAYWDLNSWIFHYRPRGY